MLPRLTFKNYLFHLAVEKVFNTCLTISIVSFLGDICCNFKILILDRFTVTEVTYGTFSVDSSVLV